MLSHFYLHLRHIDYMFSCNWLLHLCVTNNSFSKMNSIVAMDPHCYQNMHLKKSLHMQWLKTNAYDNHIYSQRHAMNLFEIYLNHKDCKSFYNLLLLHHGCIPNFVASRNSIESYPRKLEFWMVRLLPFFYDTTW